MKWTTTKPTEPGWYWARRGHRSHITDFVIEDGELVHVANVDTESEIRIPVGHYNNEIEWAGPIPTPEEP